MVVLVTGAAGSLGSFVTRELIKEGIEVRATDRAVGRNPPAKIEVVNLLHREDCYKLVEGVHAVVHLGNHPGYSRGAEAITFNENTTMNMNVFQAASEMDVKKVVYASSIQAFCSARWAQGEEQPPPSKLPYLPLDSDVPPNPGNPYALSKVVGETTLRYFVECRGLASGVAVRYPGMMPHEHFGMRRRWMGGGRRRQSFGLLDEAFSYLSYEDAAAFTATVVRADLPGFRTYFPAARTPRIETPIPEIIETYFPNVPLRRLVSEMNSLVDLSKIERETGWSPKYEMADVRDE